MGGEVEENWGEEAADFAAVCVRACTSSASASVRRYFSSYCRHLRPSERMCARAADAAPRTPGFVCLVVALPQFCARARKGVSAGPSPSGAFPITVFDSAFGQHLTIVWPLFGQRCPESAHTGAGGPGMVTRAQDPLTRSASACAARIPARPPASKQARKRARTHARTHARTRARAYELGVQHARARPMRCCRVQHAPVSAGLHELLRRRRGGDGAGRSYSIII